MNPVAYVVLVLAIFGTQAWLVIDVVKAVAGGQIWFGLAICLLGLVLNRAYWLIRGSSPRS